jgi:putative transposase
VGHLYQDRYKSILADKESYLSELSRYFHLNPARTEELRKNLWSSLKGYLDKDSKEPFL